MVKHIVTKEYSKCDIDNSKLDKLQSYLKNQNLTSALKVTKCGIETNSWVGVIKYKNIHLEILPKLICDNDKNEHIFSNLIFMLSFTKKLDIKTSNIAKLSNSKNLFIEILIREYAKSLFDCLKKLLPKMYVRQESNLSHLKGKIKFNENIKSNIINQAKFYCEYDEFSENNLLNKLFLFVSTCLHNITSDTKNKKILKFIINYYADINLIRFDKFRVSKIKLLRNQEQFKKPFNLAKMFVENVSVDLSKNKFENITLIWDMNKLFEEFIFELMRKTNNNWKFTAQKGKKLLDSGTNKLRNTFVDIFAENKNQKIIIDTKYKKFNSYNDFSNADIFQVSIYCLLHNTNHAILLYPRWKTEIPNISAYYLNTDDKNIKIEFKAINLKYNNLNNHLSDISKEIYNLLP